MRHVPAFAAVVTVLVITLATWSSPAAAHAELRETLPPTGAVLDESPSRVELVFSEPVEAAIGGIRLYDSNGDRLDRGDSYHPDQQPDRIAMDLDDLDDGSYVVTWRVVSADSHPVNGAFTFRVGPQNDNVDTRALATRLLAADGGEATVGAVYAVLRVAVFVSLLLLVGGGAFVALIWPAGIHDRRTRRVLTTSWVVALLATAVTIGVQGAYGAGLGLVDAADPAVISSVLGTRFGATSLVRLGLLVCLAAIAVLAARRQPTEPTRPTAIGFVVVGVAVLATSALAGHASTGRWVAVAVPVDTVHLTAVAMWLGGLTLLAAAVLIGDNNHDVEGRSIDAVVPRFSRVAFGAVIIIVATGVFQSVRQVGSVDALTGTIYGRLLAAKIVVFAVMVALAAASRAWVRRRYTSGRTSELAVVSGSSVISLRKSVAGETATAVIVLALTALLVNAIPGRTALALPVSTEIEASDELLIDVTIDPAKAGPLELHFYTLSPAGLPLDVEEVTAVLELPDRDIGPLKAPLVRAGPNHFAAYGFDVPIAGDWTLTVTARTSDVDQDSATTEIRIR